MKKELKCPKCEGKTVERIPRDVFRKFFLFWDRRRRFRCWTCDTKFYR